jgi:hypothetical protein
VTTRSGGVDFEEFAGVVCVDPHIFFLAAAGKNFPDRAAWKSLRPSAANVER